MVVCGQGLPGVLLRCRFEELGYRCMKRWTSRGFGAVLSKSSAAPPKVNPFRDP